MSDFVRKKMTLADGEVSYLEWEGDGPLLHFAHATGFNAQVYQSLLTPLQGGFHVTAADLRGHGFSTLPAVPGEQATWTNFGIDLANILEKIGRGDVESALQRRQQALIDLRIEACCVREVQQRAVAFPLEIRNLAVGECHFLSHEIAHLLDVAGCDCGCQPDVAVSVFTARPRAPYKNGNR